MAKLAATSRDPEEWQNATQGAREVREHTAQEVAATVAEQLGELIVAGDMKGGRALAVMRVRQIAEAERSEDPTALRAAVMDLAVAAGAWVAALDMEAPSVAVG